MARKERKKKAAIAVEVGRAIAEQRKLMGLTQPQVAELLGVEKETISRLETGTIVQTVERLHTLSEAFKCPITRFFPCAENALTVHAATIGSLLDTLSPERQQAVVECVAILAKTLRDERSAD